MQPCRHGRFFGCPVQRKDIPMDSLEVIRMRLVAIEARLAALEGEQGRRKSRLRGSALPLLPLSLADTAPPGGGTFTISGFCKSHNLARSTLYALWRTGGGPDSMLPGTVENPSKRRLISFEAAARWRRAGEEIARAEREAQEAAEHEAGDAQQSLERRTRPPTKSRRAPRSEPEQAVR